MQQCLGDVSSVTLGSSGDFTAFRSAAREFVRQHVDHIAIAKVRSGRHLTATDVSELEQMFLEAGVGSTEDIERARMTEAARVRGFGVFLRTIAGLDKAAVQVHLADLIADGATADQIEFIDLVVDHLAVTGVIDPGASL